MSLYERVYELVWRTPAGRYVSHGQLALMLDNLRASRTVGHVMRTRHTPGVPYHRMVCTDGSTAPAFGPGVQQAILEAERMPLTADDRVELGGCRWGGA